MKKQRVAAFASCGKPSFECFFVWGARIFIISLPLANQNLSKYLNIQPNKEEFDFKIKYLKKNAMKSSKSSAKYQFHGAFKIMPDYSKCS